MEVRKILPISYNGAHCYNIELQSSFDGLVDSIRGLDMTGRRICIVADSNVDALYGARVQQL